MHPIGRVPVSNQHRATTARQRGQSHMDANFIPVIGLVSIAAMFITFSLLNARNQQEVQRTLRAALERGAPLTPELVAQLNTNRPSGRTDLRRGIVIISIGVAAIAAGWISGAMVEFATVAAFPICMGLGFLLVWKLDQPAQPAPLAPAR